MNSRYRVIRVELPALLPVRQDRRGTAAASARARGSASGPAPSRRCIRARPSCPRRPPSIRSSKWPRTELGSAPSNSVVFVVTRKPAATAALIPSIAMSYPPSRQTEKSWCSRWPSRCTENEKILAGLEKMKFFFQKQRVRAHIDVLLARDETLRRSCRSADAAAARRRESKPSACPIPRPPGSTLPASAPASGYAADTGFCRSRRTPGCSGTAAPAW